MEIKKAYDIVNKHLTKLNDERYEELKNALYVALDCMESVDIHKKEGDQWISVEDKLPSDFEKVLTIDEYEDIYINRRYKSKTKDGFRFGFPTHWMPLPEPPKEK